MDDIDRKDILLRAAFDLLRRSDSTHYGTNAMEILSYYDEANCDGFCLMNDIAIELDIPLHTDPIPLETE